jgi:hypothetical protein
MENVKLFKLKAMIIALNMVMLMLRVNGIALSLKAVRKYVKSVMKVMILLMVNV